MGDELENPDLFRGFSFYKFIHQKGTLLVFFTSYIFDKSFITLDNGRIDQKFQKVDILKNKF